MAHNALSQYSSYIVVYTAERITWFDRKLCVCLCDVCQKAFNEIKTNGEQRFDGHGGHGGHADKLWLSIDLQNPKSEWPHTAFAFAIVFTS